MTTPRDRCTLCLAALVGLAFAVLAAIVVAAMRYFDAMCWACG